MTIDPSDNEKAKKKPDRDYYEMVRLTYINDYNITLLDASKTVSEKNDYEYPNFNTLKSIKTRNAVHWEKRNTAKTIKAKSIKKADAIALNRKKNSVSKITDSAPLEGRTPKKGAKKDAPRRGDGGALKDAPQNSQKDAPKKGKLLPVGGSRTANFDSVFEVTETVRNDNVDAVHDNETIDLRAVVLDRHRQNLNAMNDHIFRNVGMVNRATYKLENILDIVINNPLLSSPDATAEDKKAVLELLTDNPLIKALNMLQKTAKSTIFATSEAMRCIGTIQAAERVAWDLESYSGDISGEDIDNEEEDARYERLEQEANKKKIEMFERSAQLKALSQQFEQVIDDNANVGIVDTEIDE